MLLAILLPACNNPSPPAPSGMVAVPAGEFFMGCNEQADTDCTADEKPGRMVYLDAFAIDTYEVTVAEYPKCVEAGKCTTPDTGTRCNWDKSDRGQHPINCVDWNQADAYCRWAGKRLLTEAEWEKAARGTDKRVYPWGNEWDAGKAANGGSRIEDTVAVGSYAAGSSPYGVHDMSGNVWEWTADWYDSGYYHNSPVRNPQGPARALGSYRSMRGGSLLVGARFLRVSHRRDPGYRGITIGFRCAQ